MQHRFRLTLLTASVLTLITLISITLMFSGTVSPVVYAEGPTEQTQAPTASSQNTVDATSTETLTATATPPPPLKSDKYLNDTSLIVWWKACTPQPCFHDILVEKTTFVDAVSKIKANPNFSNLQQQDRSGSNPAQATWSTAGGEPCCNMVENINTGLVAALLIRVAPKMTVAQVIERYGPPHFVLTADYSSSESIIMLIYPNKGMIIWGMPGDATSTVQKTTPIVAIIYLYSTPFNELLHFPLLGWAGYKSYANYASATLIQTAQPTLTPTATR